MEQIKKDVSSESIYMNIDDSQSKVYCSSNTAAQKPAASEGRKACFGNPAAVCLGLLCVLLLVLTLSMWIKHDIQSKDLQSSYNNMSTEREQLQSSYNNMSTEREQLQSSYNHVSLQREQLQSSYNHVIAERDKLKKENNNLASERNQLQTIYDILKSERDAMQKELRELDTSCPVGWTKFKCSCYYISQIKGTFDQSREDCRVRGADLVIINSEEEQRYVSGFRQRLWLGLTDRDAEGQWKWVDNTPLGFGYWKKGEPNNIINFGTDEDCAEVVANADFGETVSRWNDIPCNYELFGLCEKKTCCKQ